MKRRYSALADPPKIEIHLFRAYVICDYESNPLPGHFTPIRKENGWYICRTMQGGNIHVRPAEFLEEA